MPHDHNFSRNAHHATDYRMQYFTLYRNERLRELIWLGFICAIIVTFVQITNIQITITFYGLTKCAVLGNLYQVDRHRWNKSVHKIFRIMLMFDRSLQTKQETRHVTVDTSPPRHCPAALPNPLSAVR